MSDFRKVLIAGKNEMNDKICAYFSRMGVSPILAEDVAAIRSFEGEIGNFSVTLARNERNSEEAKVAFALVSQQPACEPLPIDGGRIFGLYEPDKIKLAGKQAVFLLDYYRESPTAAATYILKNTAELAAKGLRVFCLSRFMRTADYEAEALYLNARNSGVNFIKYETIDIKFDKDGIFKLRLDDGAMKYELSSKAIFADGTRDVGGVFRLAAKIFRLRTDEKGYLSEDRYFMEPARTSRRGVYYLSGDVLNPGIPEDRFEENLFYILNHSLVESRQQEDRPVAVIEGDKCAFCYTCRRACPHAALRPNPAARAMESLSAACEGCGVCVALCPCDAITLKKTGSANIDDLYRGENKSGKTLVLCCANSAALAMGEILPALGGLAAEVDARSVPCGGGIGFDTMAQALESYDKVLAAVCTEGACKHFDGNKRACAQTGRLADVLEAARIAGAKVACVETSCAMPWTMALALADFLGRPDAFSAEKVEA